jgi:hypothetical protein
MDLKEYITRFSSRESREETASSRYAASFQVFALSNGRYYVPNSEGTLKVALDNATSHANYNHALLQHTPSSHTNVQTFRLEAIRTSESRSAHMIMPGPSMSNFLSKLKVEFAQLHAQLAGEQH